MTECPITGQGCWCISCWLGSGACQVWPNYTPYEARNAQPAAADCRSLSTDTPPIVVEK